MANVAQSFTGWVTPTNIADISHGAYIPPGPVRDACMRLLVDFSDGVGWLDKKSSGDISLQSHTSSALVEGNIFTGIVRTFNMALGGTAVDLTPVLAAINTTSATQTALLNDIKTGLGKLGASPEQTLRLAVATLAEQLSAIASGAAATAGDIYTRSTAAIDAAARQGYQTLADAAGTLTTGLKDTYQSATDWISNIGSTAYKGLTDLSYSAWGNLTNLTTYLTNHVGEVLGGAGTLLQTMVAGVGAGIKDAVAAAGRLLDGAGATISSALSGLIESARTAYQGMERWAADLRVNLGELGAALAASTKDSVGLPLEKLGTLLDVLFGVSEAGAADIPSPLPNPLAFKPGAMDASGAVTDAMVAEMKSRGTHLPYWWRNTLLAMGTFVGVFSSIGQVGQTQGLALAADVAELYPWATISPSDAVQSNWRGLIDEATAVRAIRRAGFSDADARIIIGAARTLPPEGELIAWWLRSIITDAELDALLKARGYSNEDVARFKKAAYFVPPVGDLVTMAVREAFTPDIAQRFGQYEDFPPQFAEHAKKQGVSEEWAKAYWASHWGLPSPEMGFAMFQRQIITRNELEQLLRALDIMPFWRDKLTELAYRPLTRVDVRRMYDLGAIDLERVVRAYKDEGYSDADAVAMGEFTRRLAQGGASDDPTDLTQITKTNILQFFRSGLLSHDQAYQALLDHDFTEAAASILIANEEMKLAGEERKALADHIIVMYEHGQLSDDSLMQQIGSAGFSPREQARLQDAALKAREKKRTLPPVGDIRAMYKAAIIGREVYVDALESSGFSPAWAERYARMDEEANRGS